ncbi:hypothetical protein L6452_40125 [Arctium lappa]|uniref:Uncharacterized protein n=1 Tax=Arctium lappa TaxID=4217 RepID=A0ACB8XLD9_ARCLA|nr:hypothetical protein L6452_40125 [Arctium lappa]
MNFTAFAFEEPIVAAGGRTGKPKSESISDAKKPKANGKNGIEMTKMSQKVMNERSDDIEALMPKLRHSYYYTKPTIDQLAARERADPGYIGRVKDFVVGRDDAGSIRFLGEIDLRGLELEPFIEIIPGSITLRRRLHHSYPAVEDRGFEFVSYNPIAGEYKWRTKYFNRLGFLAFKGREETSNKEDQETRQECFSEKKKRKAEMQEANRKKRI